MNRALLLERPLRSDDGMGGHVVTWQAVGQVWAEIRPGAGRELGGEDLLLSSVPHRITLRAAPPGAASRPVPGQRFREGTRLFDILAVTERDPEGRYLQCFTREEVPK
nr:head-tail adaptor protein [Szabonella alba]